MIILVKIHMLFLIMLFPFFPSALSPAQNENRVTLSFVGDIMAHRVNYIVKDYSVINKNVKDILLSDDLTFGNLEAPVNTKGLYSDFPRFQVSLPYVQAVIDAGVDVFSLANNHSIDQYEDGVRETIKAMNLLSEKNAIAFSGLRADEKEEIKPITIQVKGFKIGFIAVTMYHNMIPKEKLIYKFDQYSKKESEDFLALVERESKNYDIFIVSYHGDWEYFLHPPRIKIDFFKKILSRGANIVYSHHPHVVQPFEVVNDNGVNKLIIYSLGNFISAQRYVTNNKPIANDNVRANTGDSFIIQATLEKKEGKASLVKLNPIMITNHQEKNQDIIVVPMDKVLTFSLGKIWIDYYKTRKAFLENVLAQSKIPDSVECWCRPPKTGKIK
jgi:poly-gamma-glutamate capsule biosynthesis protein CapA/YwtB (metallophosphatase superfamily)